MLNKTWAMQTKWYTTITALPKHSILDVIINNLNALRPIVTEEKVVFYRTKARGNVT